MSAILDDNEKHPVIQVLYALYPGFGGLEFSGVIEVLSKALHQKTDSSSKAFESTIVAPTQGVTSSSGWTIRADIDYEDAEEDINDYDVVVIPGAPLADIEKLLTTSDSQPMKLAKAFAEAQQKDPSKERTLFTTGLASLLLGKAGLLQGFGATTSAENIIKLELVCQQASRDGDLFLTDVKETNYVVNNARFSVDAENLDDDPFILREKPDLRRKSIARKGSNAWKESMKRRESNAKRAAMRLGGLRVITSGGKNDAWDASLYIVGAFVSVDSALDIAGSSRWNRGVCVNSIDV